MILLNSDSFLFRSKMEGRIQYRTVIQTVKTVAGRGIARTSCRIFYEWSKLMKFINARTTWCRQTIFFFKTQRYIICFFSYYAETKYFANYSTWVQVSSFTNKYKKIVIIVSIFEVSLKRSQGQSPVFRLSDYCRNSSRSVLVVSEAYPRFPLGIIFRIRLQCF